MTFIERLTSVQGRIVTGLALVTAVVVGLAPDTDRPFDWVRAGAIVTAAIAWLFAEVGGERKASEHDKALYADIIKLLPVGAVDFLKGHDFGGSYIRREIEPIHDLALLQGARNQFQDKKLQRRWSVLHDKVRKFSSDVTRHTWPVRGNTALGTVHPDMGDPEAPEAFIQERIDLLNAEGTDLGREIDAFEPFARSRLRL